MPPTLILDPPAADQGSGTAFQEAPAEQPPRPATQPLPAASAARWVLLAAGCLFLLSVALRLNGSSVGFGQEHHWQDLVLKDAPSGRLLWTPKAVRSDEWMVWTPAILSQARQRPAFPTTNLSLGPGMTPLLMSLPARHYTMLLRPQLWGYFLLPIEYGFAWNWNFKIFGLFAAMFIFFRRLAPGQLALPVFGALCVLFSPLVQWWFSSPSMLPEMLAYWALGVTAALRICGGPAAEAGSRGPSSGAARANRPWAVALAVLILAVSLANIMLCCYPPFEIVLSHLGVFIVAGYLWQHRLWTRRCTGLLCAALGLAALFLLPWFLECYPTLQLVAHTVYPGQRQCYGGGLPLVRWFAGFLAPVLSEANTPGALFNVCEASSFYPLWLLPLGLGAWTFIRMISQASARQQCGTWLRQRGLKVALCAYLLLYTLFALIPFPGWLCRVTLLSRIIEVRGLAGAGLAGLLLVLLQLAAAPARRAPGKMTAAAAGIVWTVLVVTFLISQHVTLPSCAEFLDAVTILVLTGVALALGLVYLLAPGRAAIAILALASILLTARVNPLCQGLPELVSSPVLNTIHEAVQADPRAEWAFYDSKFGVEALKSTGARVVNGVRIIPDPELIDRLDPSGLNRDALNRYDHLVFNQSSPQPEVGIRLFNKCFCLVEITAQQVRRIFPRVKYLSAPQPMPDFEQAGFHLWKSWPQDRLWIYRLAEAPLVLRPAP